MFAENDLKVLTQLIEDVINNSVRVEANYFSGYPIHHKGYSQKETVYDAYQGPVYRCSTCHFHWQYEAVMDSTGGSVWKRWDAGESPLRE